METFAQYRDNSWKKFKAEYPKLTKNDWGLFHTTSNLMREWESKAYDAARNGEVLTPAILDDLFTRSKGTYNRIYHDWRKSFPQGYLNPDARKANQQHERDMIEARKLGRII